MTAYRRLLVELLEARTREPAKSLPPGSTVPWEDGGATPQAVATFSRTLGVTPPSDVEWSRLSPLRRFVLLKLCRDNHDNVNFIPALREFGLYREACRPVRAS